MRRGVVLPWEPLWVAMGRPSSVRGMGRDLGVAVETVHRWRRSGVPGVSADRVCVGVGLHPGVVWPEWWELD